MGKITLVAAGTPAMVINRFNGNLELVVPAEKGLAHLWTSQRNVQARWEGPFLFGFNSTGGVVNGGPGDVRLSEVALIQSSYLDEGSSEGHLEILALDTHGRVYSAWRDSRYYEWHDASFVGRVFEPSPVGRERKHVTLVETKYGPFRNFDALTSEPNGMDHWVRDNTPIQWLRGALLPNASGPGQPGWWSPLLLGSGPFPKSQLFISGLSMIQSSFLDSGRHASDGQDGHLEAMLVVKEGREDPHLHHVWRSSQADGFAWSVPWTTITTERGEPVTVGEGVPALIQSAVNGRIGNFEVVVPGPKGNLFHFWRDNDREGLPWSGPTVFGHQAEKEHAVACAMVESFTPSNPYGALLETALQLVVRTSKNSLLYYERPNAGSYAWSSAFEVAGP